MALITTPFGRHSTAAEVVEGIDLSGKRAIVTGAASGIGVETARALAQTGAIVTLAVRNTDAGAQVAADITATTGNRNIQVAPLDLSDRNSIAKFIAAWREPLHILVNNAGVMALPEQRTPDDWEMQFATNYLGHFALALGLHDALAAEGAAHIVSVSSSGHLMSPIMSNKEFPAVDERKDAAALANGRTADFFQVTPHLESPFPTPLTNTQEITP